MFGDPSRVDRLAPYMMQVLRKVEGKLGKLLHSKFEGWSSIDINYEAPRVERVWRQIKVDDLEFRVNLHRIHPCKKVLYHPHPWPCAVRILWGVQEVAFGEFQDVSAVTVMPRGSVYSMSNPSGWHWVRPLVEPSLSLMVTGEPWKRSPFDHNRFGKNADLKPLNDAVKKELIDEFKRHY